MFTFTCGPFATNAYIYKNFIIDAPPESFELISKSLKAPPEYLLITHSHMDHIGDAAKFKAAYPNMKVAIHPDDQENLIHPGTDGLPLFFPITGVKPDLLLKEGDQLGSLQVIETPGHTPGGISFYDAKANILFSGDTLFKGTIGNLSFPTARPHLMWNSLKKLAKLPPDTAVFSGHGDRTTIGAESWLENAEKFFG